MRQGDEMGAQGRSPWAILAALLLVQFAMGLSFLAVAPLFPLIIETYEVSRASASLLVGATSLGVAIVLVPASVLPTRIGTRWAVALGGTLMASMLLAPLAASFEVLLGARLLFALGAAALLSALPAVLVRWFEPRRLALVNGLGIVAQTLGVATSMSVAPGLASMLGWQATLGVFGGVLAVATLAWVLTTAGTASDGGGTAALSLAEVRRAGSDRLTVLLGLGFAGALGANITFTSWLPAYYQEEFGLSLERAGAYGAVLTMCGMFGSLLGSVLPLRVPRRRPFLIGAGLLMPLAGFGCFMTMEPVVLLPSLVLFGLVSTVFVPAMLTIPMEAPQIGPTRAGVAVSVILAAGNLSGFVVPLLVGAMRDATGTFAIGLAGTALLALALAACGVLVSETGPVPATRAEAASSV